MEVDKIGLEQEVENINFTSCVLEHLTQLQNQLLWYWYSSRLHVLKDWDSRSVLISQFSNACQTILWVTWILLIIISFAIYSKSRMMERQITLQRVSDFYILKFVLCNNDFSISNAIKSYL